MMIIDNWEINTPLDKILEDLRIATNGEYLKKIKSSGSSIMITCPFHGDHDELHPSCGVDNDTSSKTYGFYHCFACGAKGPFYRLVGQCFNEDDNYGKKWLIDNYGLTFIEESDIIKLDIKPRKSYRDILNKLNDKNDEEYLDESILDTMSNYHPYMVERKLTYDVVSKFKIRYDNKTNSIIFPIWDEFGNLVMLTKRSVGKKRFELESNKNKPVYLLNFLIKEHSAQRVMIVESQFNALTGWVYGIPSVALLGTGTQHQYEILEKSGIRRFLLAFDGDEAGRKGRDRFIKYFKDKEGFSISYLTLPDGKDINDLTREEVLSLTETYVK